MLVLIEILLVPGSRTSDFLPHIYIYFYLVSHHALVKD